MKSQEDAAFDRLAAKEIQYSETPRWQLPARLPSDGHVAGVCAGLAAYLGTDVRALRLGFVLLLFAGVGRIIYIVL